MAVTRILTMGSFDLMHPGHVGLFRRCRNFAGPFGTVTVAINTDEFMSRYKGRPVLTFEERQLLVESCRWVDHTEPNDGTNQAELIRTVAPSMIVIGSDWATKDYYGQLGITQDFLDSLNITLCYVPRTGAWSTTELKTRSK